MGGSSLDLKAEAFMDMIEYGEIPEDVAIANAEFIVRACNSHEDLLEALKNLQEGVLMNVIVENEDIWHRLNDARIKAAQAIAKAENDR